MKKSLFSKLMSTYFIVLIISFCLVAVFLSVWFNRYYYNQRVNALVNEGKILNTVIGEYINGTVDEERFKFELSVVDRFLGARIWLVDRYGFIFGYSGDEKDQVLGKQLTNVEIDEVRKGNTVVKKGTFAERFTSPVLTVGVPIVINNQTQGGVFFHTSLSEIKNTLDRVYLIIWMSAFFAIIISAFIIYYFSNRILIRPLGKINQTAKSIASGDFDKRVNLVSDDEIGDLAVSFNYMADSLQNLEKMRRDFISNVSHELRSPMTSVNGFIGGMLDGTIPEEKWQYYLDIVNGEIKRLIRLINDLLDLGRLESGEFSLHIEIFDVNELIRGRVIKFEERIEKKAIQMDIVLSGNKLKVKGDKDRIDQVITNLLDNSIKFVPQEGIIKIKTEVKQDRVMVSVYNNGPGIPKEDINYIWDRFHKVDKARVKGGGTGLGLSIARQIVNQHNQNIWVESGDEGTKFTFTLALAQNIVKI